jgi:hypothetical protein
MNWAAQLRSEKRSAFAEREHVVGRIAGKIDAIAVAIDPGVVHAETGID